MMGKGIVRAGFTAMMVALIPITAWSASSNDYEVALDRYFDLTYAQELGSVDIDQLVNQFRTGLSSKPQAQNCPALKSALSEFAEHDFRAAAIAYFRSPTLEEQIKQALRMRLTRADLDTYLAFAATAEGASYLRNSQAANVEVKAALKSSREKILTSPEMKALMSDMGAKLLPVMVGCKD